MGILDYLIPQTMELQRELARKKFQAGLQQPQLFNTEEMPISQMVGAYEKGYGMPYPTRQPTAPMPTSPTAPEQTQNLASNMPIEYVQPRSAEDIAMRSAGIQGRAGMEQTLAGLEHAGRQQPRIQGFFEDFGEDIEEYDIPSSLGRFQHNKPTKPGESYGDPYWMGDILLQKEETTGEAKHLGTRRREGVGGVGIGKDPYKEIYDDALNTYKAIVQKAKLDPTTALMLQMMPDMAKNKQFMNSYVTPQLTPEENRQLEQAIQLIDKIQQLRRGAMNMGQLPSERESDLEQQEAATAENYLKQKGLVP